MKPLNLKDIEQKVKLTSVSDFVDGVDRNGGTLTWPDNEHKLIYDLIYKYLFMGFAKYDTVWNYGRVKLTGEIVRHNAPTWLLDESVTPFSNLKRNDYVEFTMVADKPNRFHSGIADICTARVWQDFDEDGEACYRLGQMSIVPVELDDNTIDYILLYTVSTDYQFIGNHMDITTPMYLVESWEGRDSQTVAFSYNELKEVNGSRWYLTNEFGDTPLSVTLLKILRITKDLYYDNFLGGGMGWSCEPSDHHKDITLHHKNTVILNLEPRDDYKHSGDVDVSMRNRFKILDDVPIKPLHTSQLHKGAFNKTASIPKTLCHTDHVWFESTVPLSVMDKLFTDESLLSHPGLTLAYSNFIAKRDNPEVNTGTVPVNI